MLDINAMMKEEVKKELNKVVINGVLVGEFDDEVVTKVMNILKGKTSKPSTKASAPAVIEEKESEKQEYVPTKRIGKKYRQTDFADIYHNGKEYRVYVEYQKIALFSKTEEKKKNWKKFMAKQLFELGAITNEDENGFCFILPSKKAADEYYRIRKASDNDYAEKKGRA